MREDSYLKQESTAVIPANEAAFLWRRSAGGDPVKNKRRHSRAAHNPWIPVHARVSLAAGDDGLLTRMIIIFAFLLILISTPAFAAEKANKESTYDRVMRTGVIRCGYAAWPPTLVKDPNTGAFSGIYYDYMTILGRRLGLKIDWALELSLSTYLEDLNAGKYDVECSGGWPNALRGKFADYTLPLYYTPVYLYVKVGDTRFDADVNKINTPDVRFVTMVGEQSEAYRLDAFPKTKEVSLPGTAPLSEILMQLLYGKADVAYYDELSAQAFMKEHPGKIKRLPGPPVKVIPNNLSIAKGEAKLVSMLNTATEELLNEGAIDRIVGAHHLPLGAILPVAKPYADGLR